MTGKLKLVAFELLFALACAGQSLTLSAPANVPSGQPVNLTISYAGGTYSDITLAIPLPPGGSMEWTATAQLCPVVTCDGPVLSAVLSLPDGVWTISLQDAQGIGPDGASGPVASNSVVVTVGSGIAAPGRLSATAR